MSVKRCPWAEESPEREYHDNEWGVPVHDDQILFELLILEGAQAGLSWRTVLNKRENYRDALDGFDPAKIARYSQTRLDKLMQNAGLVRNRLKIQSLVQNAQAFLDVQEEFGSFDQYIWGFIDGPPRQNLLRSLSDVQVSSPESDKMSKSLKKRGFNFVGTTICYAYMQAVGMVNDHFVDCFRRQEVALLGRD